MRILISAEERKSGGIRRLNEYRVADAFRNLGHEVFCCDVEKPVSDIRQFDIIFSAHSILKPRNADKVAEIVRKKRDDAKLVLWTFDCLNPKYGWQKEELYNGLMKMAQYWDLVATTDHSIPWEKYVKRYLHLMQGVDETDFSITPDYDMEPQYDVMFGGMLRTGYNRTETFQYLSTRFNALYCGVTKCRAMAPLATFHGRVFGNQLTRICAQSSAVYVPKPEYGVQNYWSNRIYLMGAAGGACVVEYVDGIENEFVDGEHVLFSYNREETADKVNELRNNLVLRKQLRQSIRKHVLNNYTYTHRCKKILEALGQ